MKSDKMFVTEVVGLTILMILFLAAGIWIVLHVKGL
jgi:hypothetical protein